MMIGEVQSKDSEKEVQIQKSEQGMINGEVL